jgi:hypothetical protein
MSLQRVFIRTCFLAITLVVLSPRVWAHCDGMDGPVVKAAQKALESGSVNLVLIWVQAKDEAEIRRAFEQTIALRKTGAAAKELADRYFFETLVRVHRTGEGEPYTGLQPAGRNLGPAIPAADLALESGSQDAVLKLLTAAVEAGMREHFQQALAKKVFPADRVAAGREYVAAYVEFLHYVERVYEATQRPAHGHFPDAEGHN